MNLKRTLVATTVLVSGFAGAPAFADLTPITGFYFGALAGQTDYGQSRSAFDGIAITALESTGLTVLDGVSELDSEDIGFGAFAGYRIWDYFAIEAVYVDLGELKYNADVILSDGAGQDDIPGSVELTQSASGPALTLVGILPFDGPWEVYARAGVLYADTEFGARIDIDGTVGEGSDSETFTETLAGVGFAFHIGDHISVRAEYTKVFDVGDEEADMEDDVNFINLHFVWRL
jgi:opacity protein-like surface antigen